MEWLFKFEIGSDDSPQEKTYAYGVGHAMRCLELMRVAQERFNIESAIWINPSEEAIRFAKTHNLPYFTGGSLQEILELFSASALFIDINYLPPAEVNVYRRELPVINLAPRGLTKFYADLNFLDISFWDMEKPADSPDPQFYSGPAYAVIGSSFRNLRDQIDSGRCKTFHDCREIALCMGGMDSLDLTSQALDALQGIPSDLTIRLILGPFYPEEKIPRLQSIVQKSSFSVRIIRSPNNMAEAMYGCSLGIFAAGILTYEALSIGIPSFNFALSEFHQKRIEELSMQGVILPLILRSFPEDAIVLKEAVCQLSKSYIHEMAKKALAYIDARGALRIVEKSATYVASKNSSFHDNNCS